MNTILRPEEVTTDKGNTFSEESELLRELFNDPELDVEGYIKAHQDNSRVV